jgi:hypothetical protein
MLATEGVEFAESTVTLVVAVAAFTVVGLMWMATTFGRTGIGVRHHLPGEADHEIEPGFDADDDQ